MLDLHIRQQARDSRHVFPANREDRLSQCRVQGKRPQFQVVAAGVENLWIPSIEGRDPRLKSVSVLDDQSFQSDSGITQSNDRHSAFGVAHRDQGKLVRDLSGAEIQGQGQGIVLWADLEIG